METLNIASVASAAMNSRLHPGGPPDGYSVPMAPPPPELVSRFEELMARGQGSASTALTETPFVKGVVAQAESHLKTYDARLSDLMSIGTGDMSMAEISAKGIRASVELGYLAMHTHACTSVVKSFKGSISNLMKA